MQKVEERNKRKREVEMKMKKKKQMELADAMFVSFVLRPFVFIDRFIGGCGV